MIPKSIMLKLKSSPYLDYTFANKIRIDECQSQYEVFEKVFTNIAKDNDTTWQEIFHANSKNVKKFSLLCISCILIDKFLRNEFRIKIEDRAVLLGFYKNEIVRYYYRFN